MFENWLNWWDDILENMREENDKRIFQDAKDQFKIDEAILIAHPKYKDILSDALYQITGRIDVVWSSVCEEDKLYMITDKETIKNIREYWKWSGNNDRNSKK
jgi:hypothetical protein